VSVHEGEQARGSWLVLRAISSDYRRPQVGRRRSWPQPRYSLTWYIATSMTRGKYYCYKRSRTLIGASLFKWPPLY
jgi:hypothetical protein